MVQIHDRRMKESEQQVVQGATSKTVSYKKPITVMIASAALVLIGVAFFFYRDVLRDYGFDWFGASTGAGSRVPRFYGVRRTPEPSNRAPVEPSNPSNRTF